jgi:hypothetical protein
MSTLAWQNRWREPSREDLLSALKAHHRRVFEKLGEHVETLTPLQQAITWYGTGWHWTIEYRLTVGKGKTAANHTLCYLVPKVEAPLICVPLSEAVLEQLPMRRLSKFVRDGIKIAKCAVAIHWATWTPNNQSESDQLFDLIKRKHKLLLEPATAPSKN